ncbi:hypothetical protein DFH06DRAFT_1171218, partial [Mycena polygramma]
MTRTLASPSVGRLAACPSPALTTMRTATVSVHPPHIRACGTHGRSTWRMRPLCLLFTYVSRRPQTARRRPRRASTPLRTPLLSSPTKPRAPNLAHGADVAGILPWVWDDAATDLHARCPCRFRPRSAGAVSDSALRALLDSNLAAQHSPSLSSLTRPSPSPCPLPRRCAAVAVLPWPSASSCSAAPLPSSHVLACSLVRARASSFPPCGTYFVFPLRAISL